MNTTQANFDSKAPVLHAGADHGKMVVHDPYANEYMPDEDEINLRDIWRVIIKYKGLIISIFSLILMTTIIATLLMRPIYRATALIEIKTDQKSVVKFDNIQQTDYQPLEYKTTQQNIIQSNSVAEAVIVKLQLDKNPEINGELSKRGFISGVKEIVRNFTDAQEQVSAISEEEKEVQYIERFKDRLNVNSIRKSDLFTVSFDSFDAKTAAKIANTIVMEYVRLDRKKKVNSNAGAKQFLTREIVAIQAKLESSEKDLTDFARQNNIVDVEEKGNIMNERLADLNAQLTVVTGERVSAEALWVQSKSGSNLQSLPNILASDLISDLKKEQTRYRSEYFNLLKIYKPEYPELKQIKAQLDNATNSITLEISRLVQGLQSNYEQLVAKDKLLGEKVEQQKQALFRIKDKSIQYNILKREWESNKELYTGLLESMKEVGVAGGMEPNSISLIDKARVPIGQFKPNLTLNAALAGVLGLMAGLGVAFLMAFLDNTVRTPDDLEKVVALPSLGVVPKEKSTKANKAKNKEVMIDDSTIMARYRPLIEFRAHFERRSDIAESLRSIRTSLMFSTPKGLPKVIQVTSTMPGEGKSTIATNLALVMADNDAKVLIVDADLRKHRLHQIFNVPSSPGLSEAIISGLSTALIKETGIDNLSILTSGTIPLNPSELLGSKGMDDFISAAQEEFDHIIIDSAPLLGMADSVLLSTKVDGIIYVVHAGMANKEHLREGVKRLRRVHSPLLGAILNNADLSSKDYGYYGQYYNYGEKAPT